MYTIQNYLTRISINHTNIIEFVKEVFIFYYFSYESLNKMKKFISFFLTILLLFSSNLKSVESLEINKSKWVFNEIPENNYLILSANKKGSFGKGRVFTVIPKSYKKVIFLFHGYLAMGDPYLQRPQYLIDNMNLQKYADKLEALIVIPQMNDTVYEKEYLQTSLKWDNDGNICGGKWVNEVLPQYVSQKYFNAKQFPMYAIGLSTGAEGAIKFGISNSKYIKKVIAISGTYSIMNLDENDGEYIIHQFVLGNRNKNFAFWKQEDILTNIKKINYPLYVYSESNSVLTYQTRQILEYSKRNKLKNIFGSFSIVQGSGHNWNFWSNSKFLDLVFNTIKN